MPNVTLLPARGLTPPTAFTVAALALAAWRANAIGVVRLSCLEEGLTIELCRVSGYAAGFAPGAIAAPVEITVPYTAIRGLTRRGRALCLAIDPAACAPYNRLSLARFTDDTAEALASAYRARLRARLSSFLLPAPLGALAAAAAPPDLASGPLGLVSLGVLVALATWAALHWVVRALTWGGPTSDHYRDAFEAELSRRMGFVPAPAPAPVPVPAPAPAPVAAPAPVPAPADATLDQHALPWKRPLTIALVALAAIGAVAVMAFVQHFAVPVEPPPAPSIVARVAPATTAVDPARLLLGPPPPVLPRCICERADSPLWKDGLPVLSLLTADGPEDGGRPMEPVDGRYDFDLAVVNNGAAALRDVHVLLTFAHRNARGQRKGLIERGLFYEGDLGPGRAVKWDVSAKGTEVKVEPGVTGLVDEETGVATPDAFFELTHAHYRVVRIHAAMMLAYLRDPRAREALRLLGPPAPAEEQRFGAIRRAAADLIACEVTAEGGRLRACVLNAGTSPVRGAALREVSDALSDAPGAAGRRWDIDATLPVHDGVRIDQPLEGELPLEVFVEAGGS